MIENIRFISILLVDYIQLKTLYHKQNYAIYFKNVVLVQTIYLMSTKNG